VFLIASGSVWTLALVSKASQAAQSFCDGLTDPGHAIEKDLKFPALTITFSESAARLEDLKNPTLVHVRLDPPVAGAWKWISDTKLSFAPAQDWPADNQFRVVFDPEFFPSHVRMEELDTTRTHRRSGRT